MQATLAKKALSCVGIQPNVQEGENLQKNPNVHTMYTKFGCNSFILPITNFNYRSTYIDALKERQGDFPVEIPFPTLKETALHKGSHIPFTIGKISPWLVLDSADNVENDAALQVLQHEIEYGKFMGVSTFIIKFPANNYTARFAHNIASILERYPTVEILVQFSINTDIAKKWLSWNMIRETCDYNLRLKVSLEFPSIKDTVNDFDKWLDEPIGAIIIELSIFHDYQRMRDVRMGKHRQKLLFYLLRRKILEFPKIILADIPNFTVGPTNLKSPFITALQKVILDFEFHKTNSLYNNTILKLSEMAVPPNFWSSSSILQAPLEPLIENLDNETYKVFETDEYKYKMYKKAMIIEIEEISRTYGGLRRGVGIFIPIHVLFVGPGRGPLIDKFFEALRDINISDGYFHVTAIEKNSAVINHLNEKNHFSWNGKVNILNMDARGYNKYFQATNSPPVQLVISELIGSFGCNELMPECIDSVANLTICEDASCAFIPCKVESYVQPVYAPKLWKLASEKSMEKMYVPMLPEYQYLGSNPTAVWSFTSRPSNTKMKMEEKGFGFYNKHNSRIANKKIDIWEISVVHGFAGFFKATLTNGIVIDNLPPISNSNDQFTSSWLPAFFPIDKPLQLTAGSILEISLSRVCLSEKVWYEWSVHSGPASDDVAGAVYYKGTKVHNLRGKSFKFSLL